VVVHVSFLKADFSRTFFPDYSKIMPAEYVIKKPVYAAYSEVSCVKVMHFRVYVIAAFGLVEEFSFFERDYELVKIPSIKRFR